MPKGAFGATVTVPPVPLLPRLEVAEGDGVADGLAAVLLAALAPMTCAPTACAPAVAVAVPVALPDGARPAGTWVTVDPSSPATWPAGTEASDVAAAPNWTAICCAAA